MKTVMYFTSKASNKKYRLEFEGLTVTCSCPGFERHRRCYHSQALRAVLLQRHFPELGRDQALQLAVTL